MSVDELSKVLELYWAGDDHMVYLDTPEKYAQFIEHLKAHHY